MGNYNGKAPKVYISGLGSVLGEKYTSATEIASRFGFDSKKLKSITRKTGNPGTYSFGPSHGLEEAVCDAAKIAVENAGLNLDSIDGVFSVATSSSNFYTPDLGKCVCSRLGLYDLLLSPSGSGCSGGLCALMNASNQLIKDGLFGKNANYLLVMGESNEVMQDNPDSAFLFSDSASAVVVTNNVPENGYFVKAVNGVTTDGNHYAMTLGNPYSADHAKFEFKMNGDGLFTFLIDKALPKFASLVGLNEITDAKYFIPHQASLILLKQILLQKDLDEKRVYLDGIREKGNLHGASVFNGLEDAVRKGHVGDEDDILISGYGANLQVFSAHLLPKGNVRKIVSENVNVDGRNLDFRLSQKVDISFMERVQSFLIRHGITFWV